MGSKRSASFRIPTETSNGDCVQVTIMNIVFASTDRNNEWAALDLWPTKPPVLLTLKRNRLLAHMEGLYSKYNSYNMYLITPIDLTNEIHAKD